MSKVGLISLALIFCNTFCNGQWSINFQRNFDLYKPYTDEAQEYMKLNDNIRSNTYHIHVSHSMLKRPKYVLKLGLGYKNISHIVYDKIQNISYYQYSSGQIIDTLYYPTTVDLISKSNSLGILSDFQYSLMNKEKYCGNVGISSEFYLLEIFQAKYFVHDSPPSDYGELYPMNDRVGGGMLSAVNLSCYYLSTWRLRNRFSLGARISLGTNLYSDWDQFKKYVWLGVGVELGFGRKQPKDKETEKLKNGAQL